MKKIMFNDKYSLTQAVLDEIKTMTRREVPILLQTEAFDKFPDDERGRYDYAVSRAQYQVGDVVAVSQSYKNISETVYGNDEMWRLGFERDVEEKYELLKEDITGWTNKMFVRAEFMPHQIRIKNVRIERLQDISDEDCFKEGIMQSFDAYYYRGHTQHFNSAKEAYAALIDKVSGKGTWNRNPWVFVYDFELLKLDDHE